MNNFHLVNMTERNRLHFYPTSDRNHKLNSTIKNFTMTDSFLKYLDSSLMNENVFTAVETIQFKGKFYTI